MNKMQIFAANKADECNDSIGVAWVYFPSFNLEKILGLDAESSMLANSVPSVTDFGGE